VAAREAEGGRQTADPCAGHENCCLFRVGHARAN
jgi:hypothetical protein